MDETQQRRILSWLEQDADDVLGGDDEENECGVYPDQISEHDTDSEQECEDDLRTDGKFFLKTLAFELCRPQLQSRATLTNLPRELRQTIRRFVPPLQDIQPEEVIVPMRKRCVHCPRRTDRKFKSICHFCKGNICPIHTKTVCTDCVRYEN